MSIVLRRPLSFIFFFAVFYIVERFPDVSMGHGPAEEHTIQVVDQADDIRQAANSCGFSGYNFRGNWAPFTTCGRGTEETQIDTLSFYHYLGSERM